MSHTNVTTVHHAWQYLGVIHELLQELLVLQPGSPLRIIKPYWRSHTLHAIPAPLHLAEQRHADCTQAVL